MENIMEITVNDIETVVKIIDAMVQRGAVRGEELSIVGALRDKFSAIVLDATSTTTEEVDDDADKNDVEIEITE